MVELIKKIERLIKWGVFVSFTVMIVAVVVQVIARTIMPQPPLWTEEASRVSLLFIMSLGVGASILTGHLVNVDLAQMLMPKPLRRFCALWLYPGSRRLGIHRIRRHANFTDTPDSDALRLRQHADLYGTAWYLWPRKVPRNPDRRS